MRGRKPYQIIMSLWGPGGYSAQSSNEESRSERDTSLTMKFSGGEVGRPSLMTGVVITKRGSLIATG